MSDLPKLVEFHEEGPREGFQIEQQSFPVAQRAELVDRLAASGLKDIQVGSFVSPKAVPTMADTAELFAAISKRDGVAYTALWLNEQGFRRAQQTPGVDLDGKLLFYTTDAFCLKNNGCTTDVQRDRQAELLKLYIDAGVSFAKAYLPTAFGCNYEGDVPVERVLENVRFVDQLCDELGIPLPAIFLSDTVGSGNPEAIRRVIGAVREVVPDARIGTHLHDTRGTGAANVLAALQMGVTLFDSSIAGLGGCPFAKFANTQGAGNICTEDMAYLCGEMGIETGLDLDALIDAALFAEQILGRRLSGKLMHAGRPAHHRAGASR